MATKKKPAQIVPECNIRVTPSAAKLRTHETRNCEIIEQVWPLALKRVGEVSPKLSFVIDLLDETEQGFYDHVTKEIYLNVLLTPQAVVRIMLHEMCHANQYHTRRMRDVKINNRWGTWFDGEFHANTNAKNNDYWGSPWEVEARIAEQMARGITDNLKDWPVLQRKPWWLTEA